MREREREREIERERDQRWYLFSKSSSLEAAYYKI
jgi:hypothetical protein